MKTLMKTQVVLKEQTLHSHPAMENTENNTNFAEYIM